MDRLSKKLSSQVTVTGINRQVFCPAVNQKIKFYHKAFVIGNVMGTLAEKNPMEGVTLNGLIFRKGIGYLLIHPREIDTYTKMRKSIMRNCQLLSLNSQWNFLDLFLTITSSFKDIAM